MADEIPASKVRSCFRAAMVKTWEPLRCMPEVLREAYFKLEEEINNDEDPDCWARVSTIYRLYHLMQSHTDSVSLLEFHLLYRLLVARSMKEPSPITRVIMERHPNIDRGDWLAGMPPPVVY
jgi:hypothetical protein